MTVELTHVISTTGLDRPVIAEGDGVCPRPLLGLACIKDQYPCLCEEVDGATAVARHNAAGDADALILHMQASRGASGVRDILTGLDLTGLTADIQVRGHVVEATFVHRRPANVSLKESQ